MKGVSAESQRDLILSVGVHKDERLLSPIEVAYLLKKAVDSGTTIREISSEIMLDSTNITRFLRLPHLTLDIQNLVGWGGQSNIPFSTASEIARLRSADDQNLLGRAAIERDLSKKEVIQVVEARGKFGRPIGDCIEEVVKMRPQITRRYLFIGGVLSSAVRQWLSKMTQRDRNFVLRRVMTSVLPVMPSWEGQLGESRFSLTGGEDLDQALSKLLPGFESVINEHLEKDFCQNG